MADSSTDGDYLVLLDIAYAGSYQRAYPCEWQELLGVIDRHLRSTCACRRIAMGCHYSVSLANSPSRLRVLLTVLLELCQHLHHCEWLLQFNILLLRLPGTGREGSPESLLLSLPASNTIWRAADDRWLSGEMNCLDTGDFYAVNGWREEEESGLLNNIFQRIPAYQQLQEDLKAQLGRDSVGLLQGVDFAGKSSFVSFLAREWGLPYVHLRASSLTSDVVNVFRPLLTFLLNTHQHASTGLRKLSEGGECKEGLSYSLLYYELLTHLQQDSAVNFLLICDQLEHWPAEAKTILTALIDQGAQCWLLLVTSDASSSWSTATFTFPPSGTENTPQNGPVNATPRELEQISHCGAPWLKNDSLAEYCWRSLTSIEKRLLVLVKQADGLLQRGDILQLEPDSYNALETLLGRQLLFEDRTIFLSCPLPVNNDRELITKLRFSLDNYWNKNKLTLQQGLALSQWQLLGEKKLLELTQLIYCCGLWDVFRALKESRVRQQQSWPVLCEFWLRQLAGNYQCDWLQGATLETTFAKAWLSAQKGELSKSDRLNRTILYRYGAEEQQPIFYNYSLLLHGVLLTRQGQFRDSQYYLNLVGRQPRVPPKLLWMAQVHSILALFLNRKLEQCLMLLRQHQQSECGDWYWRFYLDFIELRLLFLFGSYQTAAELGARLQKKANFYQCESLAAVCFRWQQRCLIAGGDYTGGWSRLKQHPRGRERNLFMLEACILAGRYREALPLVQDLSASNEPVECRIFRRDWEDGFQAFEELRATGTSGAFQQLATILSALVFISLGRLNNTLQLLTHASTDGTAFWLDLYHYASFLYQHTFSQDSTKNNLHLSYAMSKVLGLVNSVRNSDLRRELRENNIWNKKILAAYHQYDQSFLSGSSNEQNE